jgi:hypothetical protein
MDEKGKLLEGMLEHAGGGASGSLIEVQPRRATLFPVMSTSQCDGHDANRSCHCTLFAMVCYLRRITSYRCYRACAPAQMTTGYDDVPCR